VGYRSSWFSSTITVLPQDRAPRHEFPNRASGSFWEIVLQAKKDGKRVACTVSDGGDVQEWTPTR
jgi:hypothetical protein